MSLHKLAEVTVTVYGSPEYTGTSDELQEITDDAEALLESINYMSLLKDLLRDTYSGLADKITIEVKGLDQ